MTGLHSIADDSLHDSKPGLNGPLQQTVDEAATDALESVLDRDIAASETDPVTENPSERGNVITPHESGVDGSSLTDPTMNQDTTAGEPVMNWEDLSQEEKIKRALHDRKSDLSIKTTAAELDAGSDGLLQPRSNDEPSSKPETDLDRNFVMLEPDIVTEDLPQQENGIIPPPPHVDGDPLIHPNMDKPLADEQPIVDRETTAPDRMVDWEELFKQEKTGAPFFDAVKVTFEKFVDSTSPDEESLVKHIDSIIQYALADVACADDLVRSSKRIDSYFYIHRRLEELINKTNQNHETLAVLEQCILEVMGSSFQQSHGEQPNVTTHNREIIARLDLPRYLASINEITDEKTLLTFFALVKLLAETKKYAGEQSTFNDWTVLLSKIKTLIYPVGEFVETYSLYSNVFKKLPFNPAALMYLIQRGYQERQMEGIPIDALLDLYRKVSGAKNTTKFFDGFLPIFRNISINECHDIRQMSDLLSRLSNEDRFSVYFNVFSSNPTTSTDDLLYLSVSLGRANVFTSIPARCFNDILPRRIGTIDFDTFLSYAESAIECAQKIKGEPKKHFTGVFENVFSAFLKEKLFSFGSSPLPSKPMYPSSTDWYNTIIK